METYPRTPRTPGSGAGTLASEREEDGSLHSERRTGRPAFEVWSTNWVHKPQAPVRSWGR